MRVKNANGTIMESTDAFVIETWKAAGFQEVADRPVSTTETVAEAAEVTKPKRSRKKQ